MKINSIDIEKEVKDMMKDLRSGEIKIARAPNYGPTYSKEKEERNSKAVSEIGVHLIKMLWGEANNKTN